MLSTDELLDWLALYEISPWGEDRADMRAAVQSVWNRGAAFTELRPTFPYVESDIDDISDEDEAEFIEVLDAINRRDQDAPAGTAKPETDRVS